MLHTVHVSLFELVIHSYVFGYREITTLPVDVGITSDVLMFKIEDVRLDNAIAVKVKYIACTIIHN